MRPVYNGYEERYLTGEELIGAFPDEYVTDRRHHATVLGISVSDFLSLHRGIEKEKRYRVFVNGAFCKVMREDTDGEVVFFGHTTLEHVRLSHSPEEVDIVHVCPECGSGMEVKRGKHGYFLGCTGYPKCRHTESVFVLGSYDEIAAMRDRMGAGGDEV